MTTTKKREPRQGLDLTGITKAIETVILITAAIYKGVRLVIEEIRLQWVSPESSDDNHLQFHPRGSQPNLAAFGT